MKITRNTQETMLGPGDWFSGTVYIDMIATPNSAYRLYKAWPGAVLTMVPDAGHAPTEPGTISALIEATEEFKNTGGFEPPE